MKSLQAAFVATTFSILLASVSGRICRSGFNTSIYGIPVAFWEESATCSSTSAQSCFLGEVTLDTSFFDDEVSLTYGSCISTAYESSLECQRLFYGSNRIDIGTILDTVPQLDAQLDNTIKTFSKDAAEKVKEFLKNENGELDNLKVIEAILGAANVTVPENVQPVLKEFDTVIVTAMLNASQTPEALVAFLASFSELGTTDAAASEMLHGLFNRTGVQVPDEYKPLIDNLPGFISQYLQNLPNYAAANTTLFNLISKIGGTTEAGSEALVVLLKEFVPKEYNLDRFFDTLPALIDELAKGNFEYVSTWNLNGLVVYSEITPATQAVSNSTFELIKRMGFYQSLTDEVTLVITYLPGYYYNFFPDNSELLDMAFFNASKVLDAIDPVNMDVFNFVSIFEAYGLNINHQQLDPALRTLNALYEALMTRNLTRLWIESINTLKATSTTTQEGIRMSNSLFAVLKRVNVTVPTALADIITRLPGLFITAFPEHEDLINTIYNNISENLNQYDPLHPDYTTIAKSILDGVKMLGLPEQIEKFLEQSVASANFSDPTVSLESTINWLKAVLPPQLNQTLTGLDNLPDLLQNLIRNNIEYLSSWNLEVLKAFSRITPATMAFSNSTFDMLRRFGLYGYLTEELKIMIEYQPGLFYINFPDDTSQLESALFNISQILDAIVPSPNMDFTNILQLYSLYPSTPGIAPATSTLNALFDLMSTQNVTRFGIETLNALKESSTSTAESIELSKSFLGFLGKFNVTVDPSVEDIIRNIPGAFITAFPEYRDIINLIYTNVSENLNQYDALNLDYKAILVSSLEPLAMLNLPESVQVILQQLVAGVNFSDPIGSLERSIDLLIQLIPEENNQTVLILNTLPELFNQLMQNNFVYLNSWSLELLKAYSKINPVTMRLSNSIFELAQRFGFYENLTDEVKTFITYQAGYFYQLFHDLQQDTQDLDNAFGNISFVLESIDNSNVIDIKGLLNLISPDLTISPTMEEWIAMLEGFITVTSSGDVDAIGKYGLKALKNYSISTAESTMLADSIIEFYARINITLPEEWKEVIRYFPGIYIAAYPDNVELINVIFANISQGFDSTDINMENLDTSIRNVLSQLEMLNITFTPEAQKLLIELPKTINVSDPVASFEAVLEVVKGMLPVNYMALIPLLDTLPGLMSELIRGNAGYINSWQILLLKQYSITTPATEKLANSVLGLITHLGFEQMLSDDLKTWIAYQPGYFYQYFPGQSEELDKVFYNISAALDGIDPTRPNLEAFFNLFSGEIDTPQAAILIPAIEEFLNVTPTGNATLILDAAVEMVQKISQTSAESIELSDSILLMLTMSNLSLPQQGEDIIRSVPGVFLALFPDQSETIRMIYSRTSQSIVDSLSSTFNIQKIFADTLVQLQMANVSVPSQVVSVVNNLRELFDAVISGNYPAIDQWLVTVLPLVSPPYPPASTALSDAVKHIIGQIDGFIFTDGLGAAIEYLTKVPFIALPLNDTTLISIYSGLAENLLRINLTDFDPSSVRRAFKDLFLIAPGEIRPLLTNTEEMIIAAVSRNMTALVEWGAYLQSQYCDSNSVTVDFSKALHGSVNEYGELIPASYETAFECIPGILYKFMPNQTVILNQVFQQATLMNTNYTAYVEEQLKQVNYTLTQDLVALLELWPKLQTALMEGNLTVLVTLAEQFQATLARETELSKLIITILSKYGIDVTDAMALNIHQSSASFYSPSLAEYFPIVDTILSSLNYDIAEDKDIGTAMVDAFQKANITIPVRVLPVLENLKTLISGIMSKNGDTINLAILGIMVSYNNSFPSDQIQYSIAQYRLQLAFQRMVEANLATIPDEIFVHMAEMYRLLLKMSNVSESYLRDVLIAAFPDGRPFIEIFFQVDPKDSFSLITDFATWISNPERNTTVLASHIRTTIELIFSKLDVDLGQLLSSLAQPTSCKYASCATDGCNEPGLLEGLKVVVPTNPTTRPVPTTAEPITYEMSTTSNGEDTTQTLQTKTTTSGRVITSKGVVNLNFVVLSSFFSAKWLLS